MTEIARMTLGYDDTAPTTSEPYAIDFGTLVGTTREIGTPGSGQELGPAVTATIDANVPAVLQVTSTDWVSDDDSFDAGQLAWRRHGTTGAWTPMTTDSRDIENVAVPGDSFGYDLRFTVPPTNRAGRYTGTVTYTALPDF